jgi:hypothetical protein
MLVSDLLLLLLRIIINKRKVRLFAILLGKKDIFKIKLLAKLWMIIASVGTI